MMLKPQEVFSIMAGNSPWCGIDVRSENEFTEGHWSGFHNIPILNNEHRHLVGTTYKQKGQEQAVALGFELVNPLKIQLLESWQNQLTKVSEDQRFVTCWRGGMRSKFTQSWLKDHGLAVPRVDGGVKALRQMSLNLIDRGPQKILLIGGMTGNGKTELLQQLPEQWVIDLEALAHHRGSSFGGWMQSAQPSQSTFENNLAMEIFKKPGMVIMEAESRLIGHRVIPEALKNRMDETEIVILESSTEERVDRLLKEYVTEPMAKHGKELTMNELKNNLMKIQRKLGGLQTQNILKLMEAGEHREWITALLEHYYDKMYSHALNTKNRTEVFRGDKSAVVEFLRSRFN